MSLKNKIADQISNAVKAVFDYNIVTDSVVLQPTRKEFEGTFTFVTFTLTKDLRSKPEEIGEKLGEWLKQNASEITGYNVVKGFLNLVIAHSVWIDELNSISQNTDFGKGDSTGETMMVEYSSPNTNKPLHLGHLRNNFLGYSVSEILREAGNEVVKTQIINDRGIHICKSMLAWQKYGEDETPESSGMKGDKLAGKYYVRFDQEYKKEISALVNSGKTQEEAEKEAPIYIAAQDMLLKWEDNDTEVRALWEKMNSWVYDGFDVTYKTLGVDFDKLYYESDTYLVGRDYVLEGLEKGVFFKKDDGSVWVDLTNQGMDEKLLLRSDGTSVYMTQDIGTAILRFKDYPKLNGQVYTVGNEQDYHFKVLFLILKKLGFEWAQNCFHLSYGMVDLPTGKMKSREGTVVDADDLIQEMIDTAQKHTEELNKTDDFSKDEATELYRTLALGAVKFFLLKVDPKKRMLFNPEESIEFQGHTGPFIQYSHARISAILRKASEMNISTKVNSDIIMNETEVEVIESLVKFPESIQEAAANYSPAVVANYVYDLAKTYNRFYAECSIFKEEDEQKVALRIQLSQQVAKVIKKGMRLLGADVPERM